MANIGINYLFDSSKLHELKSWNFSFHFELPRFFATRKVDKLARQLKTMDFKAIRFTCDLDRLPIDRDEKLVTISIEVPEEIRRSASGQEDYESDFWRLLAAVYDHGFSEVYYEARDWEEEPNEARAAPNGKTW